ncbi:DUF397 domain-containing protein [Streptomyces sp. NBC_01613]|uniref:DUF397 domain-containing protein n=1 Tax=Streptomyces sp. NBC_01613 TaxID=2975896 RepID=UPI00386F1A9A
MRVGTGTGHVLGIADTATGGLAVCDSKAPDGPLLRLGAEGWSAFLAGAKKGTLGGRRR